MEIRNIKEWCAALDESAKTVEQYEKQLTAFFNNLKVKPDYNTPFMTGCYNKESFVKGLLKSIPKIGLISLIISAITFGVVWLTKGHNTTTATILAIVVFVLLSALTSVCKFLMYKSQIKNLSKLEENLKGIMTTVPMEYRASDKMKTIAKVFFTKTSIKPDIILDVVDDYFNQFARTSKFHSVMFDLPCNCPFLNVSDTPNEPGVNNTVINTDSDAKKKSEFLPTDIDTKIFEGSKDSDKDLAGMIGLADVKDQIQKFRNRISFYGKDSNNGCHMAFLGSAGTGKTTVARIVTKMLFDLGYIKKNQYIEISGDYLCAGSTSRASAIIEYAYDGVLFIDEAYLMTKNGSEVIGVLLKAMEDHRKDFVCILAGYEEQMTKLFATNEGFSSRIKHSIYFGDYSEDEMLEIFNYFIKDYNNSAYRLDESAVATLLDEFSMEKRSKSFGNARTVRNAVDAIMDYYADRSIREKSNTHVITLEDVNLYVEDRKKALQHELKNASAADQLDEQIIRLSELKNRMKNGSENPDEDLSKLIGLESFKNEIDILKSQKEFYGQTVHQKILLLGEDGCGKSTITKILTGYLHQLGYIRENKYLEIPAELLKGSYVGHTAKRAEAIISYASGGVLYVKNYNGLVDSSDSYAGEALSALTTAINENTNVTIVLADRPSISIDMIKNMFTFIYEFPVYDANQLLRIFDLQATQQNFFVEDAARRKVYDYIMQYKLSIRDIQQIFQRTVKQHISNFNGDESTKFLISTQDLVLPEVTNIQETLQDEVIKTVNQVVQSGVLNNIGNAVNNQTQPTTPAKPKLKLNVKPKS